MTSKPNDNTKDRNINGTYKWYSFYMAIIYYEQYIQSPAPPLHRKALMKFKFSYSDYQLTFKSK